MNGITAAVLGSPIAHSLSPVLHTAGYHCLGIAATSSYSRCEVTEEELSDFLSAHPEHTGFSLTMPLKTELVRMAAEAGWPADDTAVQTGAANTLIRHPAGQRIANTDVIGIVEAVSERLSEVSGERPVGEHPAGENPAREHPAGQPGPGRAALLGSGATAASAVVALHRLGVAQLEIFARRPERAAAAAELAGRLGMESAVHPLAEFIPGAQPLTVSTLPGGALRPDSFSWSETVGAPAVLLDVAYADVGYSLGADFAAHGGQAISGQRMLIHQAVEQQLLFAAAAGIEAPAALWRPRLAAAMSAALSPDAASADTSGGPR